MSQQFCGNNHADAKRPNQHQALVQQPVQLFVVLCAIVESYHRSCSDGVANEHGGENHAHIHHHAIGCNAVFPGVFHKLEVIQHGNHAHGNITHKF